MSKSIFEARKAAIEKRGHDDEQKLDLMSILRRSSSSGSVNLLIQLIVKANNGTAKGDRLSDEELVAQIRCVAPFL